MNTNKTLIEQQIEELKKLAEREEIMKKAREYREIDEISVAPSRAELNPAKEETKYIKLYFDGFQIKFMKTLNQPKTTYYHNSQVATVEFSNEANDDVRININMKDVWIDNVRNLNMYISKKPGTQLWGSVMDDKGKYDYFTIKIEKLLEWKDSDKNIKNFIEQ